MITSLSFPARQVISGSQPIVTALGAHLTPDGLAVNVFAAHASAVELCLLDPDASASSGWREERIMMAGPEHGVWHVLVAGVGAGQHYGFRVHGTWEPRSGKRHNPHKLLLDPYARGIVGDLSYDQSTRGQINEPGHPAHDAPMCTIDSLGHVPHSVVVDSPFTPHPADRPRTPWADTVIYEAHVRGLTKLLPGVPEHLRGTYAGLAHPATIAHLKSLGVTAVELLPIHTSIAEPHLIDSGLTNYWGYNTLGFFAPHAQYAMADSRKAGPSAVLDEVKGMVQLLHEAGIEVLLDVVFNHTCEGGADSLHLCWRGLDNQSYYLHDGGSPTNLVDVTGCGNTLDFTHPRVVQLALDSLRFWADDVGFDGFRFDLAVTLGRDQHGFRPDHPFLVALQTDPILSDRKLIAEPWDMGPGGWRTGQFPAPIAEWNDRFRNTARTFWLSDPAAAAHGQPGHGVRELATRLAGSVDLFGMSDPPFMRGPRASVNFITAHDGFTMADLTAYEHKHNEANGENNRDGTNDNRSWNHGFEGNPAGDATLASKPEAAAIVNGIRAARLRTHRNLLATLLLSAGTPMLTAGDEFGRSQGGNNNAYCQDNEISWVDWDLTDHQHDLLATTQFLLTQRRDLTALRTNTFFRGRPPKGAPDDGVDLAWFTALGAPFVDGHWHDPHERAVQMLRRSSVPNDPAVLLAINGSHGTVDLRLAESDNMTWTLRWDSAWSHPDEGAHTGPTGAQSETTLSPLTMRLYVSTQAAHNSPGPTS